ncbi:MAG: N-6 DNA methylase, partial [Candidatus Pacearchaeota archaeon]|nr:N-6 DNA methylase [Candidatus Pacearchaeota archaeon]
IKEASEKIVRWDPYDTNKSADWFDPEWMFGIRDGFDIVIGNPPHGANMSEYIGKIESIYRHYDSRKNSASFFISLINSLLRPNGIVAYIIPKSLTYVDGWKPTRNFILNNNQLLIVLDISKSFENVLLEQVVVVFKRNAQKNNYTIKTGSGWDKTVNITGEINKAI